MEGSKSTAPRLLELRTVTKRYGWGRPWVLRDVSVVVDPGVVIEVSGPNGAGKSTLLRILAGATMPNAGQRHAAPEVVMGYVPETLTPAPSFAAIDYLRHHARIRGLDTHEGDRQIDALARRLQFEGLLEERLHALSKGSLHKVALAQALLGAPSVLVLDEPFSGLDVDARTTLSLMLRERARGGAAIVFSDHREGGLQHRADRRWLLGDGEVREHTSEPSARSLTEGAAGENVAGATSEPILRTVTTAASDRELQDMLAAGWHIVEVRRSGSGGVEIEGVPPRRES